VTCLNPLCCGAFAFASVREYPRPRPARLTPANSITPSQTRTCASRGRTADGERIRSATSSSIRRGLESDHPSDRYIARRHTRRVSYPPDPANSGYASWHTPATPLPPTPTPDTSGQFYLNRMNPPPPPPARWPGWKIALLVGALVAPLIIVAGVVASLAPSPTEESPAAGAGIGTPAPYDALPGQEGPTSATSTVPATSASVGPRTSFGDGTWEVGSGPDQVPAGKYKTTVPNDSWGCYWERLRGTGGTFDEIIANGNGEKGSPVIVTISASDKAFKASDCGTWSKT
jgi:hypothetical protein